MPLPLGSETILILCDIFEREMNLRKDRIWIYNQRVTIPPAPGLFVSIDILANKPFGASRTYENDTTINEGAGGLVEVQTQNVQDTYTVTFYSRNEEARIRKDEGTFVLHSTYCEQQQERHSFKVGFVPMGPIDVSYQDGGAIINRYQITFNILKTISRRRVVEYFDKYNIPPQGTNLIVNQ